MLKMLKKPSTNASSATKKKPKMIQRVVVAKAVVADSDKNILLIRRSATDPRRPHEWDLPGGWVDDDEDFVSAVAREIDEETAIKIPHNEFRLAYTLSAMRDKKSVSWLFFTGRTHTHDVTLSYEHDKFQWVDLETAIGLIEYHVQKDLLKYVNENNLLD